MATLIPFRRHRYRELATYALKLSARYARLNPGASFPPREPERLGNLLQRLTAQRPALVVVVENLVVEMLRQLDR